MPRSENSYVVPPCHVEIAPLQPGEVQVDSHRAVFRGRLGIHCTYPGGYPHILPRRATIMAVYTMHIPVGYELRRVRPPGPSRAINRASGRRGYSSARRGRPLGSTSGSRLQAEQPTYTPSSPTAEMGVYPLHGQPVTAEEPVEDSCPCSLCLRERELMAGSSVPTTNVRAENTPGPSFRPVSGRTRPDLNRVIVLSSDEEEEEEDPEEDPDEDDE